MSPPPSPQIIVSFGGEDLLKSLPLESAATTATQYAPGGAVEYTMENRTTGNGAGTDTGGIDKVSSCGGDREGGGVISHPLSTNTTLDDCKDENYNEDDGDYVDDDDGDDGDMYDDDENDNIADQDCHAKDGILSGKCSYEGNNPFVMGGRASNVMSVCITLRGILNSGKPWM